jgi:hypothetical protein
MAGSDEDRGRSRRLGAEDRGWSSIGRILDGRMIERSGDAVCGLHRAQGDEKRGFLGLALKPRFGLKTGGYSSYGLASKPLAWVSRFGPQNRQLRFGDLAHKITTTVSWFGPQNQVGYGLSVVPQNRQDDEDRVALASRYSGLFHLEACQARVSLFGLKTCRGTMRMVHMASS